MKDSTRIVDTYDRLKETLSNKQGLISAFWCENVECEEKIKEETKATTRCLPLDAKEQNGVCIYCGKNVKHRWLFGQAY